MLVGERGGFEPSRSTKTPHHSRIGVPTIIESPRNPRQGSRYILSKMTTANNNNNKINQYKRTIKASLKVRRRSCFSVFAPATLTERRHQAAVARESSQLGKSPPSSVSNGPSRSSWPITCAMWARHRRRQRFKRSSSPLLGISASPSLSFASPSSLHKRNTR